MERSNNERPVAYICLPYAGDTKTNTENAKRYSRYAVDAGVIPFAPHLLLPLYMKEESEHGMALYMDLVFLSRCDELWIFGKTISSCMQAEIDHATKLGKRVRYFTENLIEGGPQDA